MKSICIVALLVCCVFVPLFAGPLEETEALDNVELVTELDAGLNVDAAVDQEDELVGWPGRHTKTYVITVDTKRDFQMYVNAGTPVVIEYIKKSCRPCKSAASKYKKLAKKYTYACFLRAYIDVWDTNCTTSLPTFDVYNRGVQVNQIVGPKMDELEKVIKEYA